MCAILDASKFGAFKEEKNADMAPVKLWLNSQRGKLVYATYGRYGEEWSGTWGDNVSPLSVMTEFFTSGVLAHVPDEKIRDSETALENARIQSNDRHVLTLAHASSASLLISSDKALHKDFKTIIGGSIYQHKDHKHLLKPDICP